MAIKLGVKDGKDFMASWPTYQSFDKAINEEKRTIEFVFSDETIDRDREVIRVSGWDIKSYKNKNPVVLWAHSHGGLPIGRSEKTWIDKDSLKGRVLFTSEETGNGLGEAVFNLFNNKFLNCGSVGFIGIEDKWYDESQQDKKKPVRREFLRQELLEYSCCPVPANPNAGVIRSLDEFDSTEIRKELDWMKSKGIMDEGAYIFLTKTYDFLEERKALFYTVQQCKHNNCQEGKEKGECEYGSKQEEKQEQSQSSTQEGSEEKEIELDESSIGKIIAEAELEIASIEEPQNEEKQFEIQTLIFPKTKWNDMGACKNWAKEHDFRTDKVDETDSSWRFRQADPGDFTRLRTICINPGRSSPMGDCKVKAVGGPKKAIEDIGEDCPITLEEKEAIEFFVLEKLEHEHMVECMRMAVKHMDEARNSMGEARNRMMEAMMESRSELLNSIKEASDLILEEKRGAVLNSKNKKRIKDAIEALQVVLAEAEKPQEEEEGFVDEEEEDDFSGLEKALIDENEGEEDWESILAVLEEEGDSE